MKERDTSYLALMIEPIRTCADYKPKFGHADRAGLSLAQFQALYRSDPFYQWLGLDHPLMYAAHKAAGGMTSVYRQIGVGCERLFRAILQDELKLLDEDVRWEYAVQDANGKTRLLRLDARISLNRVGDEVKRKRLRRWMTDFAGALGVSPQVSAALTGVIFEVRQGYKSKDSKRQNADIANAAAAYAQAYLPCAAILSAQIDEDVLWRYQSEKWAVLTGVLGADDPLISTYDFMRDIIGYDLAAFFERNRKILRAEVSRVLDALLVVKAK